MYSTTVSALLIAAAAAGVNALPGNQGDWSNNNKGDWGYTTCAAIYSTSTYTTDVPYVTTYYKTLYKDSTSIATVPSTSTVYSTFTKPVVKTSKSTSVTVIPVTSYKTETKVVNFPYTAYETCTETSTKTVQVPKTIVTQVPSVGSWPVTSVSHLTSSTVVATSTCGPCDKDGKPSGSWAAKATGSW